MAVQSEVEKRNFPIVAQHFQRCANNWPRRLRHFTEGQQSDVNELKEPRLPKIVRPFNLSYESTLLDSTVLLKDFPVSFVLQVGISIREAKKEVYLISLGYQKELDLIVMTEQRQQHRLAVKRDLRQRVCGSPRRLL